MEKWELFRCVYDYDGLVMEIENPELFKKLNEVDHLEISYVIGETFKSGDNTCVHTILEGRKDYLEQVMAWRDKYASEVAG